MHSKWGWIRPKTNSRAGSIGTNEFVFISFSMVEPQALIPKVKSMLHNELFTEYK
jgi:hypothetical protein